MKRREFIILSSIGATSASLLSACGHPEERLIPAFIPDDDYVPGIDYWKASTCGMCPAGCGIIVRTREHKANKIEGNPLHPVNRGALCARGQAGLEVLYNPDRIKGPMKRVGERGEGKWEEISWDEAIRSLTDKLRETDPHNPVEKTQFITGEPYGITAHVAGLLMQAYRQIFVATGPDYKAGPSGFYNELLRGEVNIGDPIFDIANATYLLSFGARFLETWKSPVMYSQAYGEFRSSRGKMRGRFVHVEPRMSLTAANADEWIPAMPGSEVLVALAIAQVIVREGLSKAVISADAPPKLEEFSPEKTASTTDVPPEKIIRLAREFAKAERPLAIGDFSWPADSAINLLNAMVQNQNKLGGVLIVKDKSDGPLKIPGNGLIFPDRSDEQNEKTSSASSIELISRFLKTIQNRSRIMMIHGFVPTSHLDRWREDLAAARFIVSFSSFMDEISELADIIMPDHSYLERWDIRYAYGQDGKRVLSVTQPVLEPQHNTRQTADVMLAIARELGGEVAQALPFESVKEIVQKSVVDLLSRNGGEGEESVWNDLLAKGVASVRPSDTAARAEQPEQQTISLDAFLLKLLTFKTGPSTSDEYPLNLIVYEHPAFGAATTANLPSIQELPDTMTSVVWGSWVEINPKTAASLNIEDGDIVEIRTKQGSVQVPAVLYPVIRPDCVAIPYGQGHKFGRYASSRGVNPADLTMGQESNDMAVVRKIQERGKLIRFGTALHEEMERKR